MNRSKALHFRAATRGSTMVDYGILVGLVSTAAIVALVTLGGKVNSSFDNAGQVLSEEAPTIAGGTDGESGGGEPAPPALQITAAGEWLWDGTRGESTNTTSSSASALDLTIPLEEGDMLSIPFEVSSEDQFDWLVLTSPEGEVFKTSGQRSGTYHYHPTFTGDHTLSWSYEKDNSQDGFDDKAYVRDLALTPAAEMTRIENVEVAGSWNYDGTTIDTIEQRNNHSSTMTTTVAAAAGDVVMFDFNVSSERHSDHLTMHDGAGTRQVRMSGTRAARYAAPIGSGGLHLFTWNYTKDNSVAGGTDSAQVSAIEIIPAARVASLSGMTVTGDWSWDGSRGVSQNKAGNSSSQMTASVPMLAGETLHFVYETASEFNYDKLTVATPDGTLPAASGLNMGSASYTAAADGTYDFTFQYSKDGSGDHHSDEAIVRNFTLIRPE